MVCQSKIPNNDVCWGRDLNKWFIQEFHSLNGDMDLDDIGDRDTLLLVLRLVTEDGSLDCQLVVRSLQDLLYLVGNSFVNDEITLCACIHQDIQLHWETSVRHIDRYLEGGSSKNGLGIHLIDMWYRWLLLSEGS